MISFPLFVHIINLLIQPESVEVSKNRITDSRSIKLHENRTHKHKPPQTNQTICVCIPFEWMSVSVGHQSKYKPCTQARTISDLI